MTDVHHTSKNANMQINPDLVHMTPQRARELLAGSIEGYRLPLMDLIERQAEEIERLKNALRYWLPDETMIPAGHEIAWNEHVALIPEHRSAPEPGARQLHCIGYSHTLSGFGVPEGSANGELVATFKRESDALAYTGASVHLATYGHFWTVEQMYNGHWQRSALGHAWALEKDAREQCEDLRRRYGERIFRVVEYGSATETPAEPKAQRCAALNSADPPQDCDAPFCGCNPEWIKCIEWLRECGWTSPDDLRDGEP